MKRTDLVFSLVMVGGMAAIGAVLILIFARFIDFGEELKPSQSVRPLTVAGEPPVIQSEGVPLYSPPRPEEAPEGIREAVMLGYNIIVDTQTYARDYVGNELNCTNCHFNGGMTHAGRTGGLSLVGVAAKYPKYRNRREGVTDLAQRTNSCFERSQNGRPLPPNSDEMKGVLTYYHWISKGVPIYADIPWLGLKAFPGPVDQGNPEQGSEVYATTCAPCHGPQGKGTIIAPPVWGSGSFNDGAGMSNPETLAPFVFHNMPKGNPILSKEAAIDVAVYVNRQPRPRFAPGQNAFRIK